MASRVPHAFASPADSRGASATDVREAWRTVADRLPNGWRLDSLRCTSTGLEPEQRGEEWRALAVAPDGRSIEGIAEGPLEALADVLVRLRG